MALIRPIRLPPIKPSRDKLLRIMRDYGLRRSTVARLMRVSHAMVRFYLRPETCKNWHPIPQARWELFLLKVQSMYHPDEDFDLPL